MLNNLLLTIHAAALSKKYLMNIHGYHQAVSQMIGYYGQIPENTSNSIVHSNVDSIQSNSFPLLLSLQSYLPPFYPNISIFFPMYAAFDTVCFDCSAKFFFHFFSFFFFSTNQNDVISFAIFSAVDDNNTLGVPDSPLFS